MRVFEVACVVGARPNFMKIAPIIGEMRQRRSFRHVLIHTGQHSSPEMSDAFFRDLELPHPDIFLDVAGGTSNNQTARIMQELEPILCSRRPDLVLVVGDVNSTIASALVAAKAAIPIAHVEAGLRSFDRTMPEEINRIVTDALSDYLFTTEDTANQNLAREGVPSERVFFCGNVMIDTLLRFRGRAQQSDIVKRLSLPAKGYAVVTLHRPANVDDVSQLAAFIDLLDEISASLPVVFPLHPRTRKQMKDAGIASKRVQTIDPLGYLDFVCLMSEARLVLTDSGGIQEETTILNVPCITLRNNTERPVTVQHGTNRLAGTAPEAVLQATREALSALPSNNEQAPPLWDGKAAGRILDVLEHVLPERLGQVAAN